MLVFQTETDKVSKDHCVSGEAGAAILSESEWVSEWDGNWEKEIGHIVNVYAECNPRQVPYKYRNMNMLVSMFTSLKIWMHYTLLVKLLTIGWKETGQAMGETPDCVHHVWADSGS